MAQDKDYALGAIPKIIFQTWKSRIDLPKPFELWRQTIRERNPEYKYVLWNDANNRRFIKSNFPWFIETYDAYEHPIMRADAVRYFFLYRFGGIYLDLDTECLKPLDPLLDAGDVVLGQMGFDASFPHSIPNAIMMSTPGQEFWLLVFCMLQESCKFDARPEHKTGPVILKKCVDLYQDDASRGDVLARIRALCERTGMDPAPGRRSNIVVSDPLSFYPVNWNDTLHQYFIRRMVVKDQKFLSDQEKRLIFHRSYLVTYWTHSWELEEWPE